MQTVFFPAHMTAGSGHDICIYVYEYNGQLKKSLVSRDTCKYTYVHAHMPGVHTIHVCIDAYNDQRNK